MQNDIIEDMFQYSQSSSHSFLIESDSEVAEHSPNQQTKPQFELSKSKPIIQLYRHLQFSDIIAQKCTVPTQLLRKKQRINLKIKELMQERAKLNQQTMSVEMQMRQTEAQIAKARILQKTLMDAQQKAQRALKAQTLNKQFKEVAEKESRKKLQLDMHIESGGLIKKSLENSELYLRMEEQKQKIKNLRKRRQEYAQLNNKLLNERLQIDEIQQQNRRVKDCKLVQDMMFLLEQNIERLKKALQRK